ncbi:MAG: hypothetical protein DMG65_11910 [Candidatus Angelobacter sp. Gp1-AA117]|nr:MAG: hypothetical protein DMG65_11910 [Candidatus Angelobacter sp. Gp1-AA117]
MNANTPHLHPGTLLFATCALLLFCLLITGCGGSHTPMGCIQTGIAITPQTATADHNVASPGNSVHFIADGKFTGCVPPPAILTNVTWSVTDTVNVSISNAPDQTFGLATCKGATAGATTVTATGPLPNGTMTSATASLTCQ